MIYFFELVPWPAAVIENMLNKLDSYLLFYCFIFLYKKPKTNQQTNKQKHKAQSFPFYYR